MPAERITQNVRRRTKRAALSAAAPALALLRRASRFVERAPSGWRRVSSAKYVVLCYHRVGTGGVPFHSDLHPADFERQMRFIRRHYEVLSLPQMLAELAQGSPARGKQAVVVTFDDGYCDLHAFAWPILKKYSIPATVYLVADAIETGVAPWYDAVFVAFQKFPHNRIALPLDAPREFSLPSPQARVEAAAETMLYLRRLKASQRTRFLGEHDLLLSGTSPELQGRMLSWDQVREMHAGGVHFGAHTMSHSVVSLLEPQEAVLELRDSRLLIEDRLQASVTDFAYPFGQPADCGRAHTEALVRCGYRSAATTVSGCVSAGENPFGLHRLSLPSRMAHAEFAFLLASTFAGAAKPNDRRVPPLPSGAVSSQEVPCATH